MHKEHISRPRITSSVTAKQVLCAICLFLLCTTSVWAQGRRSIENPASVYCEKMGGRYEVRNDASGNEYGVCIFPDKSECNAWDFLRGKACNSFSYCAQNGYDTESEKINMGSYYKECAVCVSLSRDWGEKERIPMIELMERNGEPLIPDTVPSKRKDVQTEEAEDRPDDKYLDNAALRTHPSSFDWRNWNGHSYIGPIHDQSDPTSCGSCYAFGALASAEGAYNYALGLYDTNCVDLSESYVMWCLGRLPQYNDHFFGCDGSDYDYAELDAITTEGVTWESYFPYTTIDPGSCTHWSDPTVVFHEWGRIDCLDIDGMKTAIRTFGVIDVAVNVTDDFHDYSSGIFVDTATSCPDGAYTYTNHCVGLVGWGHDAIEGDYWILRNSWNSSWGESGYMRIAVTSARVACAPTYLSYLSGTYVDKSWAGAENGTYENPYDTLSEGVSAVASGGNLFIKGGTYTGTGNVPITIDKPMTIRNYIGTATVN